MDAVSVLVSLIGKHSRTGLAAAMIPEFTRRHYFASGAKGCYCQK